jgi:hypothetical protein
MNLHISKGSQEEKEYEDKSDFLSCRVVEKYYIYLAMQIAIFVVG